MPAPPVSLNPSMVAPAAPPAAPAYISSYNKGMHAQVLSNVNVHAPGLHNTSSTNKQTVAPGLQAALPTALVMPVHATEPPMKTALAHAVNTIHTTPLQQPVSLQSTATQQSQGMPGSSPTLQPYQLEQLRQLMILQTQVQTEQLKQQLDLSPPLSHQPAGCLQPFQRPKALPGPAAIPVVTAKLITNTTPDNEPRVITPSTLNVSPIHKTSAMRPGFANHAHADTTAASAMASLAMGSPLTVLDDSRVRRQLPNTLHTLRMLCKKK